MQDILSILHGEVRKEPVSLFGVIRNEMFFLPAFFEHYRRLGVGQFLILDDRSDDGSDAFLRQQPDCVLIGSPLRYGDRIEGQRAAHLWKNAIPQAYLVGQWAICADADEFLFLPPRFKTVPEFVKTLQTRFISAVAASMVDFYPSRLLEMADKTKPADCAELFARYPWFDVGPYLRWSATGNRQVVLSGGVRERLLRKYGLSKRKQGKAGLKAFLHSLKGLFVEDRNIKSIGKVPLCRWDPGRHYLHSHMLDIAPDRHLQISIAHFKFTGVLYEKILQAVASKAHAGGSRAYVAYGDLLEKMRQSDGSFLYEGSRRFTGPASFVDAGLINDAGLMPISQSSE